MSCNPREYQAPWSSAAIFDLSGVPVIAEFQRQWRRIREEFLAAREHQRGHESQYPLDITLGRWLVTSLRTNEVEYGYMDAAVRRRVVAEAFWPDYVEADQALVDAAFREVSERAMQDNRAHHPCLVSLLDPYYPHDCLGYNFSVIAPRTIIQPHRGLDAGNIRVHLCLIEDREACITVASETRQWSEGSHFAFDDHNLHWVAHAGTRERVIVSADFSKRFLSEALSLDMPRKGV